MAERLAVAGCRLRDALRTRSRERTAFHERIRSAPFARKVQFHFDDGDAEQKLDIGHAARARRRHVHLYVCGPKGFMDAVLGTARAQGWPEPRLHYEFFSADVVLQR